MPNYDPAAARRCGLLCPGLRCLVFRTYRGCPGQRSPFPIPYTPRRYLGEAEVMITGRYLRISR
jgi:hypothetical protein